MTARLLPTLLVATLCGVLAGCSFPQADSGGSTVGTATAPRGGWSPTPEGSWSLVSGTTPDGPVVLPAGREITLGIAPPEAGGRSTCNTYGGRVRVTGERIRFAKVITTLIGCKKALAEPEGRYYSALPRVRAWRADASTLTLTGPGVKLVFRPR